MSIPIVSLSVALILAIAMIVALFYLAVNLNRKIAVYENWLIKFRSRVDDVNKQLKIVDDRNLFEKDDDVGFVFSEIVRIIKEFDDEIQ